MVGPSSSTNIQAATSSFTLASQREAPMHNLTRHYTTPGANVMALKSILSLANMNNASYQGPSPHMCYFVWSAEFILVLNALGLSKSRLLAHMPFRFFFAHHSARLYLSSSVPNSAPDFASYTVASPCFNICNPTSRLKSPRRMYTVATTRSY